MEARGARTVVLKDPFATVDTQAEALMAEMDGETTRPSFPSCWRSHDGGCSSQNDTLDVTVNGELGAPVTLSVWKASPMR